MISWPLWPFFSDKDCAGLDNQSPFWMPEVFYSRKHGCEMEPREVEGGVIYAWLNNTTDK